MTPLRLGSRYQLDERMGEGGLGVVWRGSDIVTGAGFAIKLLRPEHARDPAAVARFVRERTALLSFRHPNVVALHDMIVEGDRLALVMELVADGDLAAHRQRCGGTLDPPEATELMAQVCNALATAHAAGIVHRDLKPANILLDSGRARLTDFGIASIAGEPSLTSEGVFLGTLPYLAPEVIQGDEPTPACDSYAVGVTLYELLAGDLPFTGQAAAIMHGHLYLKPERPPGIPDSSWRLIAACLDKDPRRRPDAARLERALRTDPGAVIDPLGGPARSRGGRPAPPGTGAGQPRTRRHPRPTRSRSRRGRCAAAAGPVRGWAFGAIAVAAVAGVIALALSWPAGPSRTGAAPEVTVTERCRLPGTVATLGRMPGTPSAHPGATGPRCPRARSRARRPGTPARRSRRPAAPASPRHRLPPRPARRRPHRVAVRHGDAVGLPHGQPVLDRARRHALAMRDGRRRHDGEGQQGHRPDAPGVHPGKRREAGPARHAQRHERRVAASRSSWCSRQRAGQRRHATPRRSASRPRAPSGLDGAASGEWTVLPEWSKSGTFQSAGNEPGYVDF